MQVSPICIQTQNRTFICGLEIIQQQIKVIKQTKINKYIKIGPKLQYHIVYRNHIVFLAFSLT